jgi:pSer/pThr/pTyr-binding forkhead associated (FHA) protein
MAAKVTLTVGGGALDGMEYKFDKPARCIVGRGEDCTVRVPSGWAYQLVSRHHCQIDIGPHRVSVRDLGSRNGTYLNGLVIGSRAPDESPEFAANTVFATYDLNDGDVLLIGSIRLHVHITGMAAAKEAVEAAFEPGRPEFEKCAKKRPGSMLLAT